MEKELYAITALDGRYRGKTDILAPFVSEAGLISNRIKVEAAWLLHLSELAEIPMQLDGVLIAKLKELFHNPSQEGLLRVKELEKTTNHDVKAVEYYLREELSAAGAGDEVLAYIHFACTSEDINNLAYGLMLKDIREQILLPTMDGLIDDLKQKISEWADIPMLSRTHGQTASPTTVGKEFAVFAYRLSRQRDQLSEVTLECKMSGAVGNYNAHISAFPEIPWRSVSKQFIERLGLTQNPLTTQIENHDTMIEYIDAVRRYNTILIGFCRDIWSYVSLGYFKQSLKEGEIGSSTMPHKVNPIDFENAEGNLGVAISLAQHFGEKLPISRWQRDLTDSTVQRVLGTMFGHSLLSWKSVLKGLGKIEISRETIDADLAQCWEVLAEPIQTVMRRYGVTDAYERLKSATRGQVVTEEGLSEVIDECEALPVEIKDKLKAMTPSSYLGVSEALALDFIR